MKKLIFLILFALSTQPGSATPTVTEVLAKHLLPRTIKARWVKSLMGQPNDHSWLKMHLFAHNKDHPIGRALRETVKYQNLRGAEQHVASFERHLAEASHEELDEAIALLRADISEILPSLSRLSSHEEADELLKTMAAFDLAYVDNVSSEDMSDSVEDRLQRMTVHFSEATALAVDMYIDGMASVIVAFHKLYAAKEFEKMQAATTHAWQDHYEKLSKQELSSVLNDIASAKRQSLRQDRSDIIEGLQKGMVSSIERDLDVLDEMISQLDSPSGYGTVEVVAYLASRKVPANTFSADYHSLYSQENSIDSKYVAAMEELDFLWDIYTAINGLDKRELRALARTLEQAVPQQ